MVRLAYQPTYSLALGLQILKVDKTTILRVLVLGNGYEMTACVKACAEALTSQLEDFADALGVFDAVPSSLLESDLLSGLVRKAGNVLAKKMGPVEDLFTPGAPLATAWQDEFLLDEKIKAFPLLTLELQSRDLRMLSENSTFTLAYWWCLNQPDDEQQISFTRLLNSLSFTRMSLPWPRHTPHARVRHRRRHPWPQ